MVSSPYISLHFCPVVEARHWLRRCSLEASDWLSLARWPPLICTHRVLETSRLCTTSATLIGWLSNRSATSVGERTRHSDDQGRRKGCIWSFHTCKDNGFLKLWPLSMYIYIYTISLLLLFQVLVDVDCMVSFLWWLTTNTTTWSMHDCKGPKETSSYIMWTWLSRHFIS